MADITESNTGYLSATPSGNNKNVDEVEIYIEKEARRVEVAKTFFLLLMTGVGFLIATLSFAVVNNEDRSEFREKFDRDIKALEEAILDHDSSSWAEVFASPGQIHTSTLSLDVVVTSTCSGKDDETVTYQLEDSVFEFLGDGDMHDEIYDPFEHTFVRSDLDREMEGSLSGCVYMFRFYPSEDFATSASISAALSVLCLFVILVAGFYAFNTAWKQRNLKLASFARRSNGVLATLFPKAARDKLIEEFEGGKHKGLSHEEQLRRLIGGEEKVTDLEDDDDDDGSESSVQINEKSIAELFPEATVFFADIAGFTAWSSVREPHQVFQLLENLFGAFDAIAEKRQIFKVETIGDCYVAASGLPRARSDHVVLMARFARECMLKMKEVLKKLEVHLGPDTGDLNLRAGFHSGPVTAGVMRGKRTRFQLFGDTVNTAARMESTSMSGKIQVSHDAASLLIKANKEHWITKREDLVMAKGKGKLQTYWLITTASKSSIAGTSSTGSISSGGSFSIVDEGIDTHEDKTARQINWITEVLHKLLKKVVARRKARARTGQLRESPVPVNEIRNDDKTVLDEVKEVIKLPAFNARIARKQQEFEASIDLGDGLREQLRAYVSNVAFLYKQRENPFHNFSHVSHVIMSVTKLLSRIVAPMDHEEASEELSRSQHSLKSLKSQHSIRSVKKGEKDAKDLMASMSHQSIGQYVKDQNKHKNLKKKKAAHDHTFGITSDPLTQFACVFSALIHDADHPGIPNSRLAIENPTLAEHYKGKALAEQNSVDLCWGLLMDDSHKELRDAIFSTEEEYLHFRQLVVNSVMATDVMDKDLTAMRNAKWKKAFPKEGQMDRSVSSESVRDNVNRKATIVIEHLIQASDVSHTMQHWHIYRQWNECLFKEMYQAYKDGRSAKNPAEFWYMGEIGFFDHYIIPLAKKLKHCGVFGVSSAEYLNYAMQNRKEWEDRGQQIVAEMMENLDRPEKRDDTLGDSLTGLGRSSHHKPRFKGAH